MGNPVTFSVTLMKLFQYILKLLNLLSCCSCIKKFTKEAHIGQGMNDGTLSRTGSAFIEIPGGLVVRIRRSHRRGRGSIPRLGIAFGKSI